MFITDQCGNPCEAWRVPRLGEKADEDLPRWLVDGMLDGDIEIHAFGGLGSFQAIGTPYCLPGDLIVRDSGGQISFCAETTFKDLYTLN